MNPPCLSRCLAVFAVALFAAGCSPPPPAGSPASMAASPGAADLEGSTDHSPVPEPEGMVGIVRLGSPAAAIASLRELITPKTESEGMLLSNPQGLAAIVLGSLGAHVDVAAPIDMVIFDEDTPSPIVASVALPDVREARQGAAVDFDFVPEADGRITVTPKPGAASIGMFEKLGLSCGIFRGGAPVIPHLICATDRTMLDVAAPYLARTVARQPVGAGLHAYIPESQVREGAADGLRKANAESGGNPAAAVGIKIGSEWSDDFRDMSMSIQLDRDVVAAGLDIRFRSLRSPLSLAMLGRSGEAVPPAFWKLPKDADLALYLPGAAPGPIRAAAAPLWSQLANVFPEDDIPRAVVKEVITRLSQLLLTGGPFIIAHGAAPGSPPPASRSSALAGPHRDARNAAAGWLLLYFAEPAETWTTHLRALLRNPAIFPKKNPATSAGRTAGPQGGGKRQTEDILEVPVQTAERLPAGALHIVRRVLPNPAYAGRSGPPLEGPYDNHVFIAGAAQSTWVVVSENETLARAKLLEATGGDDGLGRRKDLRPLKSFPAGGIGFTTLKAILALQADHDTTAALEQLGVMRARGMPRANGETPIFFSLVPTDGEPQGGATLRISAEISKAGVKELIDWLRAFNP